MSLLNLTQAAAMAGISRVTLNKHLQHGRPIDTVNGREYNKITTVKALDGSIRIESSEIMRVYGSDTAGVKGNAAASVNGNRVLTNPLESKIEALQAILHEKDKLLAEKDLRISELNRTIALIEHKSADPVPPVAPDPTPAPVKRPWWKRIF